MRVRTGEGRWRRRYVDDLGEGLNFVRVAVMRADGFRYFGVTGALVMAIPVGGNPCSFSQHTLFSFTSHHLDTSSTAHRCRGGLF